MTMDSRLWSELRDIQRSGGDFNLTVDQCVLVLQWKAILELHDSVIDISKTVSEMQDALVSAGSAAEPKASATREMQAFLDGQKKI